MTYICVENKEPTNRPMKTMENTLENKAIFFAQYWGQKVLRYRFVDEKSPNSEPTEVIYLNKPWFDTSYLELKPLSQISDEDAIEVGEIINCSNYAFITLQRVDHESETQVITSDKDGDEYGGVVRIKDDGDIFWDYHNSEKYGGIALRTFWAYQYLRSKGYALPWMGVSVETQIEWGWVKLK